MSDNYSATYDVGVPVVRGPRPKLNLGSSAYARSSVVASVAPNPKKPGSDAWALYDLYVPGMTCGEYVALAGKARGATALRFDLARGYVTLA